MSTARAKTLKRCWWAGEDELYQSYHDEEWGVPTTDDAHLFEMLILEGAQAGLSWITILKKRENYRAAFDGFDAEKIARYGARKKASLLKNEGIVRNRLKIDATIVNAKAYLAIREERGAFSDYLWDFVDGRTIVNKPKTTQDVPVSTPESDAMSKDLKKRGFKFCGTTICYAFMQATGMVNDHLTTCFRRKPTVALARRRSAKSTRARASRRSPVTGPSRPVLSWISTLRLDPGLRPREHAARRWPSPRCFRPGAAAGESPVHGELCRARREEGCEHADGPPVESGRRMHHEWVDAVVPGHADDVIVGLDELGGGGARIAQRSKFAAITGSAVSANSANKTVSMFSCSQRATAMSSL